MVCARLMHKKNISKECDVIIETIIIIIIIIIIILITVLTIKILFSINSLKRTILSKHYLQFLSFKKNT